MDEEEEEEGSSKQKSERRKGFQAKSVNEVTVYAECSRAMSGRFIRSLRRLRERGQVGKR
jgi:hypothetical protein